MTVIYAACCQPLMDEERLNTTLPRLDRIRRQKTRRLQSAQKRAQSATVGLLINHLFGDDAVDYDTNGRPFIPNKPAEHISISHTDNWVFCAVSCVPIGMDAQVFTPRKSGVVRRLFSAPEQDVQSDEDFTRIWTLKEAYYKLCGNAPHSVIRDTEFSRSPSPYDPVTGCYYHSIVFKDHLFLSVCAHSKDALPINISEIALSDTL